MFEPHLPGSNEFPLLTDLLSGGTAPVPNRYLDLKPQTGLHAWQGRLGSVSRIKLSVGVVGLVVFFFVVCLAG